MKVLPGACLLTILSTLAGCGSLNPSAMAQKAGAGALKSIQEGKGLSAEGLGKIAAESAGIPTDAEGIAKKAGLPTVPGMSNVAAIPGGPGAPNAASGGPVNAANLLAAAAATTTTNPSPNQTSGLPGSGSPTRSGLVTAGSLMAMAAAKRSPENAPAKAPPESTSPASSAQPAPPSAVPVSTAPASKAPATTAASDVPGATFRIAKLKVDDVRLSDVACKLAPGSDVNGLFGPAVIAAGFKEREARLDACSRRLTDTRVTWTAIDSKTVKVHAVADDPKTSACVEKALMGSVAMVDGSCGATLTHGRSK
jgi:hypothetical protein